MKVATADWIARVCVLVSAAIVVGVLAAALRTGHLATGRLIIPVATLASVTVYVISRAKGPRP